MITYPTMFDANDFSILLPVATGDLSNAPKKIHAVYDLAGFALGQIAPDTVPAQKLGGEKFTANEAKAHFIEVAKAQSDPTKKAALNINWAKILAFLVQILPLLLPLIPVQPPAA